jgi:hypothetical protein
MIFWMINAPGISLIACYSCTTMPRFTGYLQPRRTRSNLASNILITHFSFRIRPRWTTKFFPWTEKSIEIRHLFRHKVITRT